MIDAGTIKMTLDEKFEVLDGGVCKLQCSVIMDRKKFQAMEENTTLTEKGTLPI